MRLTKIYFKRFRVPLAAAVGMLFGTSVALAALVSANYDPRPPAPVTEPEAPALNVMADLGPDPVLESLATFKITGHLVIDSQITYMLTAPSSEETPGAEITTADLKGMGYDVEPVNRCAAVIKKGPQSAPVYCF